MPFDFFSWYLDLIEQRRLASTTKFSTALLLYNWVFLLLTIKNLLMFSHEF